MNRLLIGTLWPFYLSSRSRSDDSAMQPPTQSGVTHDTAKSATQPDFRQRRHFWRRG